MSRSPYTRVAAGSRRGCESVRAAAVDLCSGARVPPGCLWRASSAADRVDTPTRVFAPTIYLYYTRNTRISPTRVACTSGPRVATPLSPDFRVPRPLDGVRIKEKKGRLSNMVSVVVLLLLCTYNEVLPAGRATRYRLFYRGLGLRYLFFFYPPYVFYAYARLEHVRTN